MHDDVGTVQVYHMQLVQHFTHAEKLIYHELPLFLIVVWVVVDSPIAVGVVALLGRPAGHTLPQAELGRSGRAGMYFIIGQVGALTTERTLFRRQCINGPEQGDYCRIYEGGPRLVHQPYRAKVGAVRFLEVPDPHKRGLLPLIVCFPCYKSNSHTSFEFYGNVFVLKLSEHRSEVPGHMKPRRVYGELGGDEVTDRPFTPQPKVTWLPDILNQEFEVALYVWMQSNHGLDDPFVVIDDCGAGEDVRLAVLQTAYVRYHQQVPLHHRDHLPECDTLSSSWPGQGVFQLLPIHPKLSQPGSNLWIDVGFLSPQVLFVWSHQFFDVLLQSPRRHLQSQPARAAAVLCRAARVALQLLSRKCGHALHRGNERIVLSVICPVEQACSQAPCPGSTHPGKKPLCCLVGRLGAGECLAAHLQIG
mmetsp:Transcript_37788/g.94990  ORF Transcript_37788/g.94990 Transcript_37788/m.94990 type:complete len:418 (+) Transcript_37788:834-2087(+)